VGGDVEGSILSGSPESSSVAGAPSQGQGMSRGSVLSTPTRLSRYGTYFHHPEKRKQSLPAFPFG
jgi:hypothetical protein